MAFFADDLLAFGSDITVGICIRFSGNICEVDFEKSYPFIMRKSTDLGLELVSEIGIYISINRQYIQFNFGKKSNPVEYFKWNRTFNMENDIVMIRNLFIVYFEKLRGYPIKDLKREIQLIEMQTI